MRTIFHIDMNAFYASVAQQLDPKLRGLPVAVAGDPEKRAGIILAKSREAKTRGVKTAQAIWQAREACPELIIVPPDYHAYKRWSLAAREIYYSYTDRVEPFGLDECWLDVTGSLALFGGDAKRLGAEISERVKQELGVTVSVGVSWNKVFSKLASEIDPGDGLIEITPENYREVAWEQAASEMIYVGPATARKLARRGYVTVGDIARAHDLRPLLGKIGGMLQAFARGEEASPVRTMVPGELDVEYDVKGIGNGMTAPHDLISEGDVKALIWLISESVAQRLREARLRAKTVSVGVRMARDLSGYSRQMTLSRATCLTKTIARSAFVLLRENQPFDADHAIRALHVRVTNLRPQGASEQYDLFGEVEGIARIEQLERSIDDLRRRFGNTIIRRGVELTDEAMATLDIKRDNTVHPIGFLR